MIHGPKVVNRSFALDEIPVYVRAGSIIPMRTDGYNAGNEVTCLNDEKLCISRSSWNCW